MTKPRRTRILYIGMVPPEVGGQEAGGIATHAWDLAMEASKRDYEVYVLANTRSSFTKDGVKVISPRKSRLFKVFRAMHFYLLNPKILIRVFTRLNFLKFTARIRALLTASFLQSITDTINPDLIHVHSLHNLATLALKLIQPTFPVVTTDHGFWQGDLTGKNLEKVKRIGSAADCVIYISEFSKEQLKKHGVASCTKKKLIYHPQAVNKIPLLDRETIKQNLGFGDKKIILFSGIRDAVKRKGLDILFKAVAVNPYLRKECMIIAITGEEGRNYASDFVRQEQIDALILDPQPWDTIVKYYNASDIFVMPSRSESFGLVYAESLLAGTPIVGCYQVLNDFEKLLNIYFGEKFNAWKEDENSLADKIIKVLNTEFDREFLRKKVIKNLSWETQFCKFDSLYKELSK